MGPQQPQSKTTDQPKAQREGDIGHRHTNESTIKVMKLATLYLFLSKIITKLERTLSSALSTAY